MATYALHNNPSLTRNDCHWPHIAFTAGQLVIPRLTPVVVCCFRTIEVKDKCVCLLVDIFLTLQTAHLLFTLMAYALAPTVSSHSSTRMQCLDLPHSLQDKASVLLWYPGRCCTLKWHYCSLSTHLANSPFVVFSRINHYKASSIFIRNSRPHKYLWKCFMHFMWPVVLSLFSFVFLKLC